MYNNHNQNPFYNYNVPPINKVSFKISNEERAKAVCTHKYPDGKSSLEIDHDSQIAECHICGAKFIMVDTKDMPIEDLRRKSNELINVIQTIKTIFIDIDDDALERCQDGIICLLELAHMYDVAYSDFEHHENAYIARTTIPAEFSSAPTNNPADITTDDDGLLDDGLFNKPFNI